MAAVEGCCSIEDFDQGSIDSIVAAAAWADPLSVGDIGYHASVWGYCRLTFWSHILLKLCCWLFHSEADYQADEGGYGSTCSELEG